MSPVTQPRWIRWAWVSGAAIVLLIVTLRPWTDPDVWWHLALGDLITAHGIPSAEPFAFQPPVQHWVDQQWLYEITLSRLVAWGGPALSSAVFGVIGSLTFVIATTGVRNWRRIPPGWVAASMLVNGAVAAQLLGVRGQVITVLGTALTLAIITRWREGDNRAVWWLVPLELVWCNLHAGFITGLAMVAMVGVLACLPGPERFGIAGRARPLLLALGAATAVTILNPAGFGLYPYIASTFTNPTLTQGIQEWLSPDFHGLLLRVFEADAVALVIVWVASGEAELTDVLLAGGMLVASLQAQRNVALFAVVATPQLARYGHLAWLRHRERAARWRRAWPGLRPMPAGFRPLFAIVILAALAGSTATVLVPTLRALNDGSDEALRQPKAAADFVASHYPGARLYSRYEMGGYLVHRFPSGRVIFIYGESAIFGDAGLQRYTDILLLRPNWAASLQQLGLRDSDAPAQAVEHAIVPANAQETSAFHELGWKVDCYDSLSGATVLSLADPDRRQAVETSPPPNAAQAPACHA